MKKYKTDKAFEHMKKKYADRTDKDNMFGVGMTDAEFTNFIIYELLGEDWYVTDPLSHEQISEIAFHEIMAKYKSGRYKKYWKNMNYIRIYFKVEPPTKEAYLDIFCKSYKHKYDSKTGCGTCKISGGEFDGVKYTNVIGVERIN